MDEDEDGDGDENGEDDEDGVGTRMGMGMETRMGIKMRIGLGMGMRMRMGMGMKRKWNGDLTFTYFPLLSSFFFHLFTYPSFLLCFYFLFESSAEGLPPPHPLLSMPLGVAAF